MIFQYYDRSGDGRIDYKEFSAILIDEGNKDQEPQQQRRSKPLQAQVESLPKQVDSVDARKLVGIFRERIKGRGARGMMGIQRLFKIMDDDGSRALSEAEFTKAC